MSDAIDIEAIRPPLRLALSAAFKDAKKHGVDDSMSVMAALIYELCAVFAEVVGDVPQEEWEVAFLTALKGVEGMETVRIQ